MPPATVWRSLAIRAACALAAFAAMGAQAGGILSLDLCSDWLIAHYSKPDRVNALSQMSARHEPPMTAQGWTTHDGSLEDILRRRPERVVVGAFNASVLRSRLSALGVPVFVINTIHDLQALEIETQRLLTLLHEADALAPQFVAAAGRPVAQRRGPEKAGDTQNPREAPANDQPGLIAQIVPQPEARLGRGRLLLLGPNGYGTGPGTFESDLLHAAGWRNHLDHPGHQALDLETLVRHPPDAVVWSTLPGAALAHRFAEHRGLRRALPPERWIRTDPWRWQCPGPWSHELIRQLQS